MPTPGCVALIRALPELKTFRSQKTWVWILLEDVQVRTNCYTDGHWKPVSTFSFILRSSRFYEPSVKEAILSVYSKFALTAEENRWIAECSPEAGSDETGRKTIKEYKELLV